MCRQSVRSCVRGTSRLEIFASQKLSVSLLASIWIQKGGKSKEKLPSLFRYIWKQTKTDIFELACLVECLWGTSLLKTFSFLFDSFHNNTNQHLCTQTHMKSLLQAIARSISFWKYPNQSIAKIARTFFSSSKMVFLVSGSVVILMTTFSAGKSIPSVEFSWSNGCCSPWAGPAWSLSHY